MEVSRGALRQNVAALRRSAPGGAAFMAVVKADAYGHGLKICVEALAGGVEWFAVANLAEARAVRSLAPAHPVLILGPALPFERTSVVNEGFVPMVSSYEEAGCYAAGPGEPPTPVHLAVDTGMGRIGVWERDAVALAEALRGLSGVRVCGVGSHFPSADEEEVYTRAQADLFARLAGELRDRGLVEGPSHIANSAGVIGYPESARDLFRAGLALYGCSPLAEFQSELRSAMQWKARVSLVRNFGPGRSVSYGRTFMTEKPTRVATVTAGYADGYRRNLSGRGADVLVAGVRCAVLGRVTMDQIMVDVTSAGEVEPGAEVVLLGEAGAQVVSVGELARKAGTIPWEIFTGIGGRVRRLGME